MPHAGRDAPAPCARCGGVGAKIAFPRRKRVSIYVERRPITEVAQSPHDHAPPHWLKTKVSGWFWSLTPACKEVARLTSGGRDHSLPLGMRVRLALHRAFCKWCARYASQLDLVHEASHHFSDHTDQIDAPNLTSDAKARMKRALTHGTEKRIVAIGGLLLSLVH